MAGECFDTNVIIALVNGTIERSSRMGRVAGGYVPVIVLGELLYGAEVSDLPQANRKRMEQVLADFSVLDLDENTAHFYAAIRGQLKRSGRPIPDNDIWIAAVAMQHGLTLITRDDHFRAIDNLPAEYWDSCDPARGKGRAKPARLKPPPPASQQPSRRIQYAEPRHAPGAAALQRPHL